MRIPVNINEYSELLDARVRFVQANYGDGEWSCILGLPGRNCNGEDYALSGMQAALIETIVKPAPGFFMYGSNGGRKLEPAIREWLLERNCMQRAWVYKELISGANVNGKLSGFIAAVRRRCTILVGPEHLKNDALYQIFNIKAHVMVPTSNAYSVIETTIKNTLAVQEAQKANLVLVCSGMAAKPLIYRVSQIADRATIIDMGATLDPYAGVWSRSGYRKEEFQQTALLQNLKGLI